MPPARREATGGGEIWGDGGVGVDDEDALGTEGEDVGEGVVEGGALAADFVVEDEDVGAGGGGPLGGSVRAVVGYDEDLHVGTGHVGAGLRLGGGRRGGFRRRR